MVRSIVKWPYLRLRTTHTLDIWYSNRYCQHLSPYQKSGGWVVCRRSFNSTGGLTPLLVFIPQSSTGGHTTHSKKCIPFTIFSNILGQIINKMYVLLPSRKVCVAQFLKPQPVVAKVLGSILGCAIFFLIFLKFFQKRYT